MTESDFSVLTSWEQLPFLAKVTNTAPNIIYIFNQKTQSNEYANRSLGESVGYSAQEVQEMGDALLPTIIHPDDMLKVGPHFEILRDLPDGEVAQLEYRVKHKNGGWIWLLAYETVFQRDEAGDVLRHLGVATDITLQKNAQESALAAKHSADAVSEELRAFAYSISHDMKAPANTLHLLLRELKEQHGASLDQDAAQLVDLSLETVYRMQNVVADVLNYTKVVGENIQFENVDLQRIVDDILEDFRAEIDESGADVKVDKLPVAKGSEVQIRILLQNLVGNALKFRRDNIRPIVTLRSSPHADEGKVNIHVRDNGIGVAAEHHQKIFDMFKRLHISTEYPGTGLGLAICKRIAISHGGTLTIDSTAGNGAEFTVSLDY